jgi:hypothetical protein
LRSDVGRKEELDPKTLEYAAVKGLHIVSLTDTIRKLWDQEMQGDAERYFHNVLRDLIDRDKREKRSPSTPLDAVQVIHAVVGFRDCDSPLEKLPTESLSSAVAGPFDALCAQQVCALRDYALHLVDEEGTASALRAVRGLDAHLQTIEGQAREHLRCLDMEVTQRLEPLVPLRRAPAGAGWTTLGTGRAQSRIHGMKQHLVQYACLRIHDKVLHSVCQYTQVLREGLSHTLGQLRDTARVLEELHERFTASLLRSTPPGPGPPAALADSLRRRVLDVIEHRLPQVAKTVVADVRRQFTGQPGWLTGLLTSSVDGQRLLGSTLRNVARQHLMAELSTIDLAALLTAPAAGATLRDQLHAWLQAGKPRLQACGGARRTLLLIPDGSSARQLAESLEASLDLAPTRLLDACREITVCIEVEQIPLPQVAASLVDDRPDLIEFAVRVRSRLDVPWVPLVSSPV